MKSEPALIGLDWGTTSLRCYLMSGDGTVLDQSASQRGIMAVARDDYETVLADSVAEWVADNPTCPIVASGMVTSRQGWVELPYLSCPADAADLASALHRHHTAIGQDVHFVTGLTVTGADGVPDVMRGEETQIVGALTDGDSARLFVLPGTHSKWVLCDGGRIVWFATFMTGEVYAVLRQHSILGRLIESDDDNEHWFDRGVEYGASTDPGAGGLLKKLFGTRALRLFDAVPADGAASHLSGLLIGSEIHDALRCVRESTEIEAVTILGETDLASLYARALAGAGLTIANSPSHAAARGQWLIARAAGLIEDTV